MNHYMNASIPHRSASEFRAGWWMKNAFLLARTKFLYANFKKERDPFYAPLTARCLNAFFGPPTEDVSYLKVLGQVPLEDYRPRGGGGQGGGARILGVYGPGFSL